MQIDQRTFFAGQVLAGAMSTAHGLNTLEDDELNAMLLGLSDLC